MHALFALLLNKSVGLKMVNHQNFFIIFPHCSLYTYLQLHMCLQQENIVCFVNEIVDFKVTIIPYG